MYNSVIDFLKRKKYTIAEDRSTKNMEIWKQWYKGKVDDFHQYHIYQGKATKNMQRLSLNMAQRCCRDWADLLLNEKVEINCDNEDTGNRLNEILRKNNFFVKANNLIEKSFAIGGGFFVQYWDGKSTRIKYITQDFCVPLSYDSSGITAIAFASINTIDGQKYCYIETHEPDDNGNYVITNYITEPKQTKGNHTTLKEVAAGFYDQHSIEQVVETNSPVPRFQQVRPNIANKDNFISPYGLSVFSGATDILRSIDLIYDSYYKEFRLGKKRLYVKDGVATFNIDKDGNTVPVFDPDDELFYSIPDSDDGDPIQESNMDLRVAAFDTALQTQLNLFSQACGFGNNAYKWDNSNITTATQVVSENSKMFRTLRKHEILLADALVNMARSVLVIEAEHGNAKGIDCETGITVNFDDSIIEDTAELKRQAITDVNMGLISKREYFRQIYNLTDEQAEHYQKKMAREIAEENSEVFNTEPMPE